MKHKNNNSKPPSINCFECEHFYTTWNPRHPRGCLAFHIETSWMPSMIIQRYTGTPCPSFHPKNKKRK